MGSVVTGIPGRKEVIKIGTKMLFPFVALGLLSLVHAGPFLIPSYTTTTSSITWYTYTSTSTMYNSCYQIAVVDTAATTAIAQLPSCSTYVTSVNPIGKKRRKRSDLLNDEIRETSSKISPSKAAESPEEKQDLTPFRNDPRLLFAGYSKVVDETVKMDSTTTLDMTSNTTATLTRVLHGCDPGYSASLYCTTSLVLQTGK